MTIERRLGELGLELPRPLLVPEGAKLPFQRVRVDGSRAFVAGHGPQRPDGSLRPGGKVGSDLSLEEGYEAARAATLAMLASLRQTLGDLDRIRRWLRVFGMVNTAPGFTQQSAVMNGCSDLLLEVFGAEVGQHARCAVGMYELPFGIPVEIEAELAISEQGASLRSEEA